jgi:hypothetical protein
MAKSSPLGRRIGRQQRIEDLEREVGDLKAETETLKAVIEPRT